jgi:hypothetical protein
MRASVRLLVWNLFVGSSIAGMGCVLASNRFSNDTTYLFLPITVCNIVYWIIRCEVPIRVQLNFMRAFQSHW